MIPGERLNLIETELRRLNEVINDIQMQINSLKTELERVSNVVNIEHSKLNQLTQQFKAHRDKKDIHVKRIVI